MTAVAPFAYPTAPHERRHGPRGYNPYNGFKDWLRDEFTFRCVYCLERELWYPNRSDSFSVDHFVPQSKDASLACEYMNLIYACMRCNSARQDVPVLNPDKAAFGDHLGLGKQGALIGLTDVGRDLIDLLHLNENPALEVRRKYLRIQALREKFPADPEIETLFIKEFGFPDNMPDLRAKRPPEGNTRPGSEESCCFARRERGELPLFY